MINTKRLYLIALRISPIRSRHPPPCGAGPGGGSVSEANTEPPVAWRRRQVADKHEAVEGCDRREQTGSCPNEGRSMGSIREMLEDNRTPRPKDTSALAATAVRPLFLCSIEGT